MMTMTLFSANNDGDHDEHIIQLMASTFEYARKNKTTHVAHIFLKSTKHTHTNAPQKNGPSEQKKQKKTANPPKFPRFPATCCKVGKAPGAGKISDGNNNVFFLLQGNH